jgi:3-oxoacyl-[acyl-carrier-protein] synthase-3
LHTPGGGFRQALNQEILDQGLNFVHMKGREIFKNAVRAMGRCAEETLAAQKISPSDIRWVIPHQANSRIVEAVAKQLDIPLSKFILNLSHTGNTSSASVPIAFNEAHKDGRIARGDLILLTVFGAGLTSGALLMRY